MPWGKGEKRRGPGRRRAFQHWPGVSWEKKGAQFFFFLRLCRGGGRGGGGGKAIKSASPLLCNHGWGKRKYRIEREHSTRDKLQGRRGEGGRRVSRNRPAALKKKKKSSREAELEAKRERGRGKKGSKGIGKSRGGT